MATVDDSVILAIDLGTTGMKVALATARGEILDWEMEPCSVELFPEGGAEQRPEDWWEALVSAARRLLGRGRVAADQVRTVCGSTQWSGTVPVDADGTALGNAIIWMDSRGGRYLAEMGRGLLRVEGFAAWKLLRWLRLTGGVPVSAKDPIAHILFLKHERPEIYAATYKFLEPKDYLNLRLTGRFASSFEAMTLHWITDNRHINDIRYDAKLLAWAGLERSKFPDLMRATDILGPLTAQAAAALGLSPDTQVVMGTPDLHAAAIGSGAVRDYEAHVYIGTSSWLSCHVPFKRTDLSHQFGSFPSAIPGRYMILDEQECAGACLTFLRDNVFFADDELHTAAPFDLWARLDHLVEQTPPGSGGVIFTPWLYGERTPVEDRLVRGGFHNLSLPVKRGHMVRAVYEGVAFNLCWLLRYVETYCKRRLERLNFIGGGARSRVWCQILADVFDRPVAQMADPILANARGAAWLGAVATGRLSWEEIPGLAKVNEVFEPDPGRRALYDGIFEQYLAIYKANRRIHAKLNAESEGRPYPVATRTVTGGITQ
jgi:xylulokinase